ncbi:MAG: hypothetical protein IJQ69_06650 [Bacteroidales bacterium]|nr:hypothetical protein [Bacteroidales bacterium]
MSKNEDQLIKLLVRKEKRFSLFHYAGMGKARFRILEGTVPVMLSVPHCVTHFREGNLKKAEKYTGALALVLHELTGCHVIYSTGCRESDPNHDDFSCNAYQEALIGHVKGHSIKVVIDLHGAAQERPFSLEIGTAPSESEPLSSLKGFDFIATLIRLSLEYTTKKNSGFVLCQNQLFRASSPNTVTSVVSGRTEAASMQLEINADYRDPSIPSQLVSLIKGLRLIIESLARVDWRSSYIDVRRLCQSPNPKPQDRAILYKEGSKWSENEVVYIHSAEGDVDLAHVRLAGLKEVASEKWDPGELVFLPNRLIHHLCGCEWSLNGDDPFLEGMPVLLSRRSDQGLPMGIPKADKINHIYLSQLLFDRLIKFSKNRRFVVFNKVTDSSVDFDLTTADYGDGGTVLQNGEPAEKVMLPRYFSTLMGLNDHPFKMIRKEELDLIKASLIDDVQRETFSRCYKAIPDQVYYMINPEADAKDLESADTILKGLGCYNVDVLSFPVSGKKRRTFRDRIGFLSDYILEKIIGKSTFLLRISWTNVTDDKNVVARLSPNMMSLLGVSDNDKVMIRFRDRKVKLRVLSDSQLTDYEVRVPAPARKSLRMNSINDVVEISRDIHHTFLRNSQAQTIAILGTILAVFQVFRDLKTGIILCLFFVPLILYFSLNEERIKVK